MADFRERHVVVTGGTGALGTAVVGELLASGAICHVPYYVEAEEQHFAHRGHPRVKLIGNANLGSQTVVTRIYDSVPKLWASIHLAGGYASWPIAETDETELMGMVRNNLLSCFLCCAAAVGAIRRRGRRRAHRQHRGPAGARAENRCRLCRLYGQQGGRRGADPIARRRSGEGRHSRQRDRAVDARYRGQSPGDAARRSYGLAETGRSRVDHLQPRRAQQSRYHRRGHSGLRPRLAFHFFRAKEKARPLARRALLFAYSLTSCGDCPSTASA